MTVTLCLLAFGAIMVYSASSARNLLAGHGDGTGYLVRYAGFGAVGLLALHVLSRRGLAVLQRLTPALLGACLVLVVAVLAPGVGVEVNGARRWIGAGPLGFQPSELLKLALVLYAARYLAAHPRRIRTFSGMVRPVVVVSGAAAALVAVEPDMGSALVIVMTLCAMLVAAGVPLRFLLYLAAGAAGLGLLLVLAQPYQQARLETFLDPWAHSAGAGFQAVQGQIALGSGGLTGVGLGRSVQKIFYLPEAHTDFILAVIGEELGVLGVVGVLALYAMIAWAGLRTARAATGSYAKLLAAGLTSLILCQATLNVFVVLGLAPLTGVPLPLISYGPTNLTVVLAAIGLLLNISARRETVVLRAAGPGSRRGRTGGSAPARGHDRAHRGDRGRRDGRARGPRPGDRRRAAG